MAKGTATHDVTPPSALMGGALIGLAASRLLLPRGRVAGSVLVPLADLPAAAAGWRRDADLVLVCRSGGRSARAAPALVEPSFARVMNPAGGMLAYNEAGLPVERA